MPFGYAQAPRTFSKCVKAAIEPLRQQGSGVLGRSAGSHPVSRAGDRTHDLTGDSSHTSGLCSELGKERPLAESVDCLPGSTARHHDYDNMTFGSTEVYDLVDPQPVTSNVHGNDTFCHVSSGSHVNSPHSGPFGVSV